MNYKLFEDKKILIFCPHQDDEINMVGGLLLKLKKVKCEIKIIYSTNGDYFTNGKYRYREAIKSLKILGLNKKNVFFLGYPDQTSEEDNHLYMSKSNWCSRKGQKTTRSYNAKEYHHLVHNEHAIINQENFIQDIYEIIYNEKPNIIICVDFDSHPDHRALSLSLECALGRILKTTSSKPIVLKCFAYPTAYNGECDFKNNIIPKTKFKKEVHALYECQNPYYCWHERISFDISKEASIKLLPFNKIFRAICCHASQMIIKKTYSIINSDQVFFLRRTDNLLQQAKISSSSGTCSYLNDFMLFDSSNIMHGNSKEPVFDLGYMQFEKHDISKKIIVEFYNFQNIESIKIYKSVNCTTNFKTLKIKYNDTCTCIKLKKYNNFSYYSNDLNLKNIKKIELLFDEYENVMLTEIEIFSNDICINKVYENDTNENKKLKVFNKLIFKIDDIIIFMVRCYHKIIRIFRKISDLNKGKV